MDDFTSRIMERARNRANLCQSSVAAVESLSNRQQQHQHHQRPVVGSDNNTTHPTSVKKPVEMAAADCALVSGKENEPMFKPSAASARGLMADSGVSTSRLHNNTRRNLAKLSSRYRCDGGEDDGGISDGNDDGDTLGSGTSADNNTADAAADHTTTGGAGGSVNIASGDASRVSRSLRNRLTSLGNRLQQMENDDRYDYVSSSKRGKNSSVAEVSGDVCDASGGQSGARSPTRHWSVRSPSPLRKALVAGERPCVAREDNIQVGSERSQSSARASLRNAANAEQTGGDDLKRALEAKGYTTSSSGSRLVYDFTDKNTSQNASTASNPQNKIDAADSNSVDFRQQEHQSPRKPYRSPSPVRYMCGNSTNQTSPMRYVSPVRQSSPVRQLSPVRQPSPVHQPSQAHQSSQAHQPSPVRQSSQARQPSPVRQSSQSRQPSPVRQASPVRGRLIQERAAVFDKPVTRADVDPTQLSLAERRKLFESGQPPKVLARFGAAVTPAMLQKHQCEAAAETAAKTAIERRKAADVSVTGIASAPVSGVVSAGRRLWENTGGGDNGGQPAVHRSRTVESEYVRKADCNTEPIVSNSAVEISRSADSCTDTVSASVSADDDVTPTDSPLVSSVDDVISSTSPITSNADDAMSVGSMAPPISVSTVPGAGVSARLSEYQVRVKPGCLYPYLSDLETPQSSLAPDSSLSSCENSDCSLSGQESLGTRIQQVARKTTAAPSTQLDSISESTCDDDDEMSMDCATSNLTERLKSDDVYSVYGASDESPAKRAKTSLAAPVIVCSSPTPTLCPSTQSSPVHVSSTSVNSSPQRLSSLVDLVSPISGAAAIASNSGSISHCCCGCDNNTGADTSRISSFDECDAGHCLENEAVWSTQIMYTSDLHTADHCVSNADDSFNTADVSNVSRADKVLSEFDTQPVSADIPNRADLVSTDRTNSVSGNADVGVSSVSRLIQRFQSLSQLYKLMDKSASDINNSNNNNSSTLTTTKANTHEQQQNTLSSSFDLKSAGGFRCSEIESLPTKVDSVTARRVISFQSSSPLSCSLRSSLRHCSSSSLLSSNKDESPVGFRTPLVSGIRSPKGYRGPSTLIDNESEMPLMHSVSFYRKQKPQEVTVTPVKRQAPQPVKYHAPGAPDIADPVSNPGVSQQKQRQAGLQELIRCLNAEVDKQQQVMSQASRALTVFEDRQQLPPSSSSSSASGAASSSCQLSAMVEAERVLLVATHRKQAAASELQRLRAEGAMQRSGIGGASGTKIDGVPVVRGSLSVDLLCLPLKSSFVRQVAAGDAELVYHFICLLRYRGQVTATELLATSDSIKGGAINFPNLVTFGGLEPDFSVAVEVYALTTTNDSARHPSNSSDRRSRKDLRAKTPKKCSGQRVGDSAASTLPSSTSSGSNAGRTSGFQLFGFVHVTARAVTSQRGATPSAASSAVIAGGDSVTWTLERVPYDSPLTGSLMTRCSLQTDALAAATATAESRRTGEDQDLPMAVGGDSALCAFVTVFDDVEGLGAWRRRWCRLSASGGHLLFWKYPECEEQRLQPVEQLQLASCVGQLPNAVQLVAREVCARPNTLLLETVRRRRPGDEAESLVLSPRSDGRTTRVKNLLSFDNKAECLLWRDRMNATLAYIRAWYTQPLVTE